jgi:hypothetical protein
MSKIQRRGLALVLFIGSVLLIHQSDGKGELTDIAYVLGGLVGLLMG